jgi:feruloyl esterase
VLNHPDDELSDAPQVTAAEAMYAGPTDAQGQHLWPGGMSYGSEQAWPSFAAAGMSLGGSFTKYELFPQDRPASYTWHDFQFDLATWREMDDMSQVYNSNNFNNPDLSAFGAAGGKLIVWQSWQDEAAGPWSNVDWYAQVEDAAGGLSNLQQYARLFMEPAGSHGQAASGSIYSMATVPALVNWVESGQAPGKLDAVKFSGSAVTRTYPIYPFPARAQYTGSGDPNDEANWVSMTPSPLPDDHFNWLGDPAHGNGAGANVNGNGNGNGNAKGNGNGNG